MGYDVLLAYFWPRVGVPDESGCWPWIGTVQKSTGYGVGSIGPRGQAERWRAHRLSYFLHVGDIPEGLVVMHDCDNKLCVNPHHLRVGTDQENNLDRDAKGRNVAPNLGKTHCLRGHEFTAENTYVTPNGRRQCRACHAMRHRKVAA